MAKYISLKSTLVCTLIVFLFTLNGCSSSSGSGGSNFSGEVVNNDAVAYTIRVYELDPTEDDMKGDLIKTQTTGTDGKFTNISVSESSDDQLLFEATPVESTDGSLSTLNVIITEPSAATNYIYITVATQLLAEMVLYELEQDETLNVAATMNGAMTTLVETLGTDTIANVDLAYDSPVGDANAASLNTTKVLEHRLFIEALTTFVDWMHDKADEYDVDAPHDDLIALLAEELADDDVFNGSADNRLPLALNNNEWHSYSINTDGDTLADVHTILASEFTGNGETSAAQSASALTIAALIITPNATNDIDGDGTLNSLDDDMDGDGVPNDQDAFPNDPSETTDTDGDGFGDNYETQLANTVTESGSLDTGTSTLDNTTGIPSGNPTDHVTNPNLPVDTDGDGTPDSIDISAGNPLLNSETCSSGTPDRSNLDGQSMLDADWDACAFWREHRKTAVDFDIARNMATPQVSTSLAACDPGAISQAAKDRFDVVFNYTRNISNLKSISLAEGITGDADLYLTQMQNWGLVGGGHFPTAAGSGAAAPCNGNPTILSLAEDGGSTSNIAGGSEGIDPSTSVISLIRDHANFGGDPYSLGHRWHMLDPAEDYYSFGMGQQGHIVKVFGFDASLADTNDGSLGEDGNPLEFIASPYEDYPFDIITPGKTAWSFQVVNATTVDLTGATVTVTPSAGGSPLAMGLSDMFRPAGTAGSRPDLDPGSDGIAIIDSQNAISFMPSGWNYDTTYNVEIGGIVVDGTTRTYQYKTRMLRAAVLGYSGESGIDTTTSGVITDLNAELMWEDPADLPSDGWHDADTRCTALTTAGESDWRLPTSEEYDSLFFVMETLTADGLASSTYADRGTESGGALYMMTDEPPAPLDWAPDPTLPYTPQYNVISQSYNYVGSLTAPAEYRCVRNT